MIHKHQKSMILTDPILRSLFNPLAPSALTHELTKSADPHLKLERYLSWALRVRTALDTALKTQLTVWHTFSFVNISANEDTYLKTKLNLRF